MRLHAGVVAATALAGCKRTGELSHQDKAIMEYEAASRSSGGTTPLLRLSEDDAIPSWTYKALPLVDLSSLQPRIRALLEEQNSKDVALSQSAPLMMYENEIMPDFSRITVSIPARVHKDHVLIFEIADEPHKIIKYQTNCYDLNNPVAEILRDYWFQDFLKDDNIGPRVYFLSAPAHILPYKTPKNQFSEADLEECPAHPRAHVRYMVMEKIPATVFDLVTNRGISARERFTLVMILLETLIPRLSAMHNKDIVHGDLHEGNIAQLSDGSFGMIDFGLAFFEAEMHGKPDAVRPPKSLVVCHMSHFNIEGFRLAYRDDVYIAFLSAAFLMSGIALKEYCERAAEDADYIHTFQRNFNLFARRKFLRRALPELSAKQHTAIADHLLMALNVVRRLTDIREKPDYDSILYYVAKARDISEGSRENLELAELEAIQPLVFSSPTDLGRVRNSAKILLYNNEVPPTDFCLEAINHVSFVGDPHVAFSGPVMSEDGRYKYIVLSDRARALREMLKPMLDEVIPTDWDMSQCEGRIHFSKVRIEEDKGPRALFLATYMKLLKLLHGRGLVLVKDPQESDLRWTGERFSLSLFPLHVSLYVDPFSGRHVRPCDELVAIPGPSGCRTRKDDFIALASLMTIAIAGDDSLMVKGQEFREYASNLSHFEQPDYDKWIREFESLR